MIKYVACVTNIITRLFFGASLFSEKTVLQEFREKNGEIKTITSDRIVFQMSLEQGLFVRTVLGSTSFYAMLFISIVGSKKFFPLMKKWNPLPPSEA